jgi:hypothetical protein
MIEQDLQKTICLAISEGADQVNWDSLSYQDWEKINAIADSQRVGSLLYWSFLKTGQSNKNQIPEEILEQLFLIYVDTTRRNLHLFRELETVIKLFNKHNIKHIVLKGAALANTVYEDIGLRSMADVDLLIPKDQISSAVDLLTNNGYKDPVPEAGPGLKEVINYHFSIQKQKQFLITLELHHTFHHTLVGGEYTEHFVPMEWFFKETTPFRLNYRDKLKNNIDPGTSTSFKLTPTAQLLQSAAHIVLQHDINSAPLIWIYDLDRLCRVEVDKLNWRVLVHQSRIFRWDASLYQALLYAKDKFNSPLPDGLLLQLSEGKNINQTEYVNLSSYSAMTRSKKEWRKLQTLKWSDRVRLILALLFPSPAYMQYRYHLENSLKLPYFYFYRWVDIIWDGLRTLSHSLSKR